jgi:hypothetical protein
MVGGAEPARRRHVLRHDRGIARDVVAEMAGDRARIDVVAAADRGRDDQPHLLALVEIGDRIGTGGGRDQSGEGERGKTGGEHGVLVQGDGP